MRRAKARTGNGIIVFAYMLAGLSCALGLFFCLIKSPQAKSDSYLAVAVQSVADNQSDKAEIAVREAVRLNPLSPKNWELLSYLLEEKGQRHQAMQASSIALRLSQRTAPKDPVYAMPAEFKLSLLALDGPDIP